LSALVPVQSHRKIQEKICTGSMTSFLDLAAFGKFKK